MIDSSRQYLIIFVYTMWEDMELAPNLAHGRSSHLCGFWIGSLMFLLAALGMHLYLLVVYGVLVQKPGLVLPTDYHQNRHAVERIFDTSYEAYRWIWLIVSYQSPLILLTKETCVWTRRLATP